MGIIERQGIKQSLAAYVGVLIGVVNLLYIYPKFLTEDELGLIRFIIDTAMMVAPLIFLGSNTIIIRFFPHFKDAEKKHNGFLFFLCAILGVGFLLFLLGSFFFQEDIVSYYTCKNELFTPVLPDIFIKICLPLLVIGFALEVISFNQIFLGVLLAYVVVLLGQIGYLRYLGQFYLKPNFSRFNTPLLKEMGSYGAYGILGSLGSRLAERIDIIMLASLSTLDYTGIYVIPLFISNVIDIPRKAISRITSPIVAEKWKEQKIEEINSLYQKTSLNQFIIGLWVLIGIWLSVDDLFSIIPRGDKYALGKYVVLILGTARVVDMITGVNSEIIGYSKYFRFNLYMILCLAAFNVCINYLLIPEFNINGAAMATLSSVIVFNLMKFVILKWKLNMQPFTWQTLWVLIIGLTAYFITAYCIPLTGSAIANMAIKSILVTLIFFGGIFYFKLSDELLALLKKTLEVVKK